MLHPSDLDLEPREFRRMAAIYDAAELWSPSVPGCAACRSPTAQPPRSGSTPTCRPRSSRRSRELAERHEILLVPHAHEPIPRDGRTPDELEVLRAGPFSGGVVGVSAASSAPSSTGGRSRCGETASSTRIARCFARRTGSRSSRATSTTRPARPDSRLSSTGVSTGGSSRGRASASGGRPPLRSFHFTGFDPERPERVASTRARRPRVARRVTTRLSHACRRLRGEGLSRRGIGRQVGSATAFDRPRTVGLSPAAWRAQSTVTHV